jgi:lipopolysaccharide assembly outer membrane protein LptD (OstA)
VASPTAAPSAAGALPPITVRSRGNSHQPVRIVEKQGNRLVYELLAASTESSLQSQNQFRGTFSATRVTFYGSTPGSTLTGTAPTTTVDRAKESVLMQGGVKAHTSEGVLLDCDRLQYDRTTGRLLGSGNVRIVSRDGYTLTGGSFTSDLRLTQVHMQ